MRSWFKRMWEDETAFVGNMRAMLVLLGGAFATNTIPTGVDGGGVWAGIICAVLAVWFTAGNKPPLDLDGFAKVNPKIAEALPTTVNVDTIEKVNVTEKKEV